MGKRVTTTIHKRLDTIEEHQVEFSNSLCKISDQMVKITPMVEEYHANKLVKKNLTEKIRNYSIVIGIVMAMLTMGDSLYTKIKKSFNIRKRRTKSRVISDSSKDNENTTESKSENKSTNRK